MQCEHFHVTDRENNMRVALFLIAVASASGACPAGKVPCPPPAAKGTCCDPPPAPAPPVPPSPPGPNSFACQPFQEKSIGKPFCDTTKSFADRADALVLELTLDEKLALLHAKPGTDGAFEDSGIETNSSLLLAAPLFTQSCFIYRVFILLENTCLNCCC